ncbi:DASH family cryptochrome [Salisediminibacterium selenitireducens]|uniref:Cryptochrome DASH n=1 Tax=Bacillus selenitireducens (strain ATCC 700615 / DSM 15326 / MLS10) TaxID=439292 RepID=D6XY59_BACIE|nr:DASH family cryptochrome [Salisediminibacterium selenitireducens]ADH98132.1 cryptochrome, DASH family [[Bacillus] selenitireducens MLS10]
MRMVNVIWFRHDLRIHDHEPLRLAHWAKEETEAVFVRDARMDEKVTPGLKRAGEHRERFLMESLVVLAGSLEAEGMPFTVLKGPVVKTMIDWLTERGATDVFLHEHPGFEERRDLEEVQRALPHIHWHVSEGHTMFRRDQLPFSFSEFPMSFTMFRKRLEAHLRLPEKKRSFSYDSYDTVTEAEPVFLSGKESGSFGAVRGSGDHIPHAGGQGIVRGGEQEALARLRSYVGNASRLFTYKETRDGMFAFDDSSKLSFWLANGSLSPKRVYRAILDMEAANGRNESSYWLFFELLWREYFQWLMLATDARLFTKQGLLDVAIVWHEDKALFQAWKDGETGFPLVDAAMRELKATGYMSNRARQNAASFLTKNLGINWLWGARYFEEQLIDYDPASNYGNWAYQAGVGTDLRELRAFNVIGQGIRYDPKGSYAKNWLHLPDTLPGHTVYDPVKLSAHTDWPQPIVDLEESLERRKQELGL